MARTVNSRGAKAQALTQDRNGEPVGEELEVKGILGTVRNATILLELLAKGPRFQSVTSLASQSGLSIATAHRVLRSLAQTGLVHQSARSQGYSLGPGLVRLAERYLSELPVVQALSPYLTDIRNLTNATIELCLLIGHEVVTIDRIDATEGVGIFRPGRRPRSALDSAAGRLLLAHADDQSVNGLPADLSRARVTAADLSAWAVSPYLVLTRDADTEIQVAVPIRSKSGSVAAALMATAALDGQSGWEAQAELLARPLLRASQAVQGVAEDE